MTSRRYSPGDVPGPGKVRVGMVFLGHGKQRVRVQFIREKKPGLWVVGVNLPPPRNQYLLELVETWPLEEPFITDEEVEA